MIRETYDNLFTVLYECSGRGANAQVEEELNTLILDLEDNDPKYKRLKAIYKDCTDQNRRENLGWKPLEFFLDEIGIQKTDWKAKNDNDNWFDYIYKIRRIGGNENIHFLYLEVDHDVKEHTKRKIKIDMPTLIGWQTDAKLTELMTKILKNLGVEDQSIQTIAEGILKFYKEYDTMRQGLTAYETEEEKYTEMTISDLGKASF